MSKTIYKKDLENKKMYIEREFNAPVHLVWKAWTESKLLEKWWAPKPWKAVTKSMDFKEGGTWLYCMEGPENEKHWGKVIYSKIDKNKYYSGQDSFCDENGIVMENVPSIQWEVKFEDLGSKTKVFVENTFSSADDIEKIIAMGFKEGFSAAHNNLDELLEELKVVSK